MANKILSGITVVDMTEGVAGPYASMQLGDMGANVIKVERREGDWGRGSRPGMTAAGNGQFLALNRNKRDIGLDVASAGGRRIIERLVSGADVVVSNYRAGVMDKLGLGYADCRALKTDIVYCTISGFGQEGPYAQLPASDTIMQAMSGIMQMVGEADGDPLRVGFPLVDVTAANHAVQAVLLALYGRLSGRGGAEIDISLMAAAMSLMRGSFSEYLLSGKLPVRQGNQNMTLAPAGSYQTSDGRTISIAVLRDSHWQKLCAALGLKVEAADARFASNSARVENRKAIDAFLVPLFAREPADVWLARLRKADILCGPINTFGDVAGDPALAERLPLDDPKLVGAERVLGTPIRYNGAYFDTRLPAPAKGEQTREVLAEFGFDEAEIAGFLDRGEAFQAEAE